jgi:hypothetical protein
MAKCLASSQSEHGWRAPLNGLSCKDWNVQGRTFLMPTQATATTTISRTTHGPRHRPRKLVKFIRKPLHNSAWWTAFLSQEAKAILINDHHAFTLSLGTTMLNYHVCDALKRVSLTGKTVKYATLIL